MRLEPLATVENESGRELLGFGCELRQTHVPRVLWIERRDWHLPHVHVVVTWIVLASRLQWGEPLREERAVQDCHGASGFIQRRSGSPTQLMLDDGITADDRRGEIHPAGVVDNPIRSRHECSWFVSVF